MFIFIRPILLKKPNLIQKAKFSNDYDTISRLENKINDLEYKLNFIYDRLLKLSIVSSILLWISIPTESRLHEHMNKLSNEIKNIK